VRVYQPGAHSQEIVPLRNSHFSVVYWPEFATPLFTSGSLLGETKYGPYVAEYLTKRTGITFVQAYIFQLTCVIR
jgi:hypothetical protein